MTKKVFRCTRSFASCYLFTPADKDPSCRKQHYILAVDADVAREIMGNLFPQDILRGRSYEQMFTAEECDEAWRPIAEDNMKLIRIGRYA